MAATPKRLLVVVSMTLSSASVALAAVLDARRDVPSSTETSHVARHAAPAEARHQSKREGARVRG